MKTTLDCIPCLFRQALDSARMFSRDPAVHEHILRDVLGWCRDMDMSNPAPVMGQRIYRRLRRLTGVKDPYLAAKKNRTAWPCAGAPLGAQVLAYSHQPGK